MAALVLPRSSPSEKRSQARRLRRARQWHAVVSSSYLKRDVLVLHRPLPQARVLRHTLKLDALVPACEEAVCCAEAVLCRSVVGPLPEIETVCPQKIPRKPELVHCTLVTPATYPLQSRPGPCSPADGMERAPVERATGLQVEAVPATEVRGLLRASATKALPRELLKVFGRCREAGISALVEEIRRIVSSFLSALQKQVLEHVYVDAESVLKAATDQKVAIGLSLQRRWMTLLPEAKAPWVSSHRIELEKYGEAYAKWRPGQIQSELLRPVGPAFAWMRENLEIEWPRSLATCVFRSSYFCVCEVVSVDL